MMFVNTFASLNLGVNILLKNAKYPISHSRQNTYVDVDSMAVNAPYPEKLNEQILIA